MISRQMDDAITERMKQERRRKHPKLRVIPLTLARANQMVGFLHRHHKPVVGYKFAIGVWNEDAAELCGAAIVSRPVARGVDHTETAEVTRLVTDGTYNACSILYAAAARACGAMGYRRIQSYILEDEPGTSLAAAGWRLDGYTSGGDWNHSTANAGTRRTDQPMGRKQRWVKDL